jgi:hypothetical protein
MNRAQKEKLEAFTDASLQLICENSTEEMVVKAAEDCAEVTLEKSKKEADKPLFLNRI